MGPLWAGIHVHERAGVAVIVGVELFTEPPGDARTASGPSAVDHTDDLLPARPAALRGHHVQGLRLPELWRRFMASNILDVDPVPLNLRYNADHWRRVAQCVLTARARGNRSTAKEVAKVWNVSRSTAKKWIARAKAEGYLDLDALVVEGPVTGPKRARTP
jgi:leucine-zipper of insertion element IS481